MWPETEGQKESEWATSFYPARWSNVWILCWPLIWSPTNKFDLFACDFYDIDSKRFYMARTCIEWFDWIHRSRNNEQKIVGYSGQLILISSIEWPLINAESLEYYLYIIYYKVCLVLQKLKNSFNIHKRAAAFYATRYTFSYLVGKLYFARASFGMGTLYVCARASGRLAARRSRTPASNWRKGAAKVALHY